MGRYPPSSGGFEAYAHYERFLRQGAVWPSESNGNTVLIAEMVPRYAASALNKLIRWAGTLSAQVALNIAIHSERERYVRNSPLAQSLARVAQSLPPMPPVEVVIEVTPRDMILLLAPIVAEHTSLDISQIFKLCEAMATKMDEEWTVTLQSR